MSAWQMIGIYVLLRTVILVIPAAYVVRRDPPLVGLIVALGVFFLLLLYALGLHVPIMRR